MDNMEMESELPEEMESELPEGIDKFSTEILIEIFKVLSPRDRLACSHVSKRWHEIARAREFHGKIKISSSEDKATILDLFNGRVFPFKKIIFVRGVSCLWQKEWKAFWEFVEPHIKEIVFGVCKPSPLNIQVFQKVLPTLPHLQKLTIVKHRIDMPTSLTDETVLNSLRELNLCKTEVSNELLTYLVDCCPVLEVLEVSQATFGNSSAVEISKSLRNLFWMPAIKFHYFDVFFFKDQISELGSLSNIEIAGIVIQNRLIGNHLGLFAAFQSHLDYIKILEDSFKLMKGQLLEFLTSLDYVKAVKIIDCEIDAHFTFDLFSRVRGLKSLELKNVNFNPDDRIMKYKILELEKLNFSVPNFKYDRTTLNKLRLVCPRLHTLSIPKLDLGFIDAFPLLERLEITLMAWINLSDYCILRSLERLTHLTIYDLRRLESFDWEFFHFKCLKCFKLLEAKCLFQLKDIQGLVERNPTIQEIQIGTSEKGQLNEASLKNTFGPNWCVSQAKSGPFKLIRKM